MASPRSLERETRVFDLGDGLGPVELVVRRNRRSRHVRLHVDEDGSVTASVPARFALRRLDAIVLERREWLREVCVRMRLAAQATEVDLHRGDPVRLLGRWVPVRIREARRSRCSAVPSDAPLEQVEALEISLRPGDDPYDVLHRWYRASARSLITERVQLYAAAYGYRIGALSVRDQRTRWGSCSHRGDLSFNWRLVLAPLWVLDSIVVHELCHLDELNHSNRFWRLLDQRYPRHVEAREWLGRHGAALRMTRPAREGAPAPGPTHGPQPLALFDA